MYSAPWVVLYGVNEPEVEPVPLNFWLVNN